MCAKWQSEESRHIQIHPYNIKYVVHFLSYPCQGCLIFLNIAFIRPNSFVYSNTHKP